MFIGPESRIALMGDNGCGKSTLIRILLEQEKQDQGSIYLADKIKISYFEQNRETLDGEKSVLKNICPDGDYVDYRGTFIHVRSYLEKFLFVGKHVELPVSRLSGGEQARLRIAQMMLRESQVLILDEPTNDLDVDTLNVLEDSIQNFPGAVILVTHDRFFMDSVATQIYSFPEPDSTNKELLTFASYFQWEQWFTAQQSVVDGGGSTVAKQNSGGQSQAAAEASSDSKASTTATNGNKNKKLSFKEKFEYENMESSIAELEQQILAVKTELESSEVTSHAQKLLQLTQQLNSLQTNLEHKFQRWAELENKLK
ncbi:MAG: ATP-binding cassette domain-containing protein, partial [Pseudobdellovibrionaceae bacterium]